MCKARTIKEANDFLFDSTNILFDFTSLKKLKDFIEYTKISKENQTDVNSERHWGDIQTPRSFVDKIYRLISRTDFKPDIIIEPTFGDGNFLLPIQRFFPNTKIVYGIELQLQHIWNFLIKTIKQLDNYPKPTFITIVHHDDFFSHKLDSEILSEKQNKILVIGNPPWVTNSEMSQMNKENLPVKSNYKEYQGIEAITGKSNFDITEAIIRKILIQFANHHGKIALLCKNTVIRNLLKDIPREKYSLSEIWGIGFDSKKIFGKNCNASLLLANLTPNKFDYICKSCSIDEPFKIKKKFGWFNRRFVSDVENYSKYSKFDGKSNLIWRHGVKHDCSNVLELVINLETKQLVNKLGETVEIEESLVYPYLKGSHLKKFDITTSDHRILLTQKSLLEDTSFIQDSFPKSWKYLENHKKYFEKRKSRVYNKNQKYAIFGVGEYMMKNYKVAIPGLYKDANFVLINTMNNKPVILDDTCYYIGFDSFIEALIVCTVLKHEITKEFLQTIVFRESKRIYTKEVLKRIDILKLLEEIPVSDYINIWHAFDYNLPEELDLTNINDAKERLVETLKM